MLLPTDTLQIYTSPYRRTRETTEGILESLTSDDPEPSPFPRDKIKVWEEPRLREQDFGNFQPCSAAMERMWQERADYGHFFYRIPDGESAADAYDRVSGFNETLWRQFGEEDFASVCVLVTHGLMTRVFLMKWFHWTVEYFEDLRNVNHCEFVVMERQDDSAGGGKFVLRNDLRTWSELKRQRAIERGEDPDTVEQVASPPIYARKRWGGCPDGCTHEHDQAPKRAKRASVAALSPALTTKQNSSIGSALSLPPPLAAAEFSDSPGGLVAPVAIVDDGDPAEEDSEAFPSSNETDHNKNHNHNHDDQKSRNDSTSPPNQPSSFPPGTKPLLSHRKTRFPIPGPIARQESHHGRDFGGSDSGAPTPMDHVFSSHGSNGKNEVRDYGFPSTAVASDGRPGLGENGRRKSVMDRARADALGDRVESESGSDEDEGEEVNTGKEDVGGARAVERRKVQEVGGQVDAAKTTIHNEEDMQRNEEGKPAGDVY
jgi:broad specificity phosphatase PhoE